MDLYVVKSAGKVLETHQNTRKGESAATAVAAGPSTVPTAAAPPPPRRHGIRRNHRHRHQGEPTP